MFYIEQMMQHPEIERLRSLPYEVGVPIYLVNDRVIIDMDFAMKGDALSIRWEIDTIVQGAKHHGATRVIVLHNHPPQMVDFKLRGDRYHTSFSSMFSVKDIQGLREMTRFLRRDGLQLADAMVVAGNTTLSMRELGYLDEQGRFALLAFYPFWNRRYGRGSIFVWKKPFGCRLEVRDAIVRLSNDVCYFSHGDAPITGSIQTLLLPWTWAVREWAITLNDVIPLRWRLRYWRDLVELGSEFVDTICERHGLKPDNPGGYRVLDR